MRFFRQNNIPRIIPDNNNGYENNPKKPNKKELIKDIKLKTRFKNKTENTQIKIMPNFCKAEVVINFLLCLLE